MTQTSKEAIEYLRLRDLMIFLPCVSPSYQPPIHLAPLVNPLNEILKGKQKYLLITAPPRHGKTVLIQHFLTLYLYKYLANNALYCGYGQDYASTKAMLFDEYSDKVGIKFNPKMNNKTLKLTSEGGGLYIAGVNGSIEGTGFNLIVVDDPVKNIFEAESLTYRNKTWNWWENSLETRLEPNASIVLLMHRWHEDDLAGRIQRHRQYECIRLPALSDCLDYSGKNELSDPLNRNYDEPLWESRFNFDILDKLRKEKPFTFQNQYQGLPRRKEDRLLKEPTFYDELPKDGIKYKIGADLAYSEKTSADYSVIVIGIMNEEKYYIIDIIRFKREVTYTKQLLFDLNNKYKVKIKTENNGAQKGVFDLLQDPKKKYLQGINPIGDKYTRALPFAELWNTGKILLPNPVNNPKSWLDDYLEEVLNFTGIKDTHDDQLDASVYMIYKDKEYNIINWSDL